MPHIDARTAPDAVAFYLSGQLLTEDYYVANKLMKGFIGSANVDTNSRLCMASSVAGHAARFGADTVPGCYEDLDEADLIVLVGSNAAWCHPVLYQRMVANKRARGARMIVIDPRRTATAEDADLHLPSRPARTPRCSPACWCISPTAARSIAPISTQHTTGFDEALARAREDRRASAATALATGLADAEVERLLRAVSRDASASSRCYSQGVNQSAQGTDKVNAIINCHLATGRIGKPGVGPFSLTGQPNAMGGREVGGLANQLAAHMDFSPPRSIACGGSGTRPHRDREGLKAVQLFDAVARGEIKALWVIGTNPAVTLPRRRCACARRCGSSTCSSCRRTSASNDTVDAGAACGAAGAGVGREERHGHEFRAAHLAPARLPGAAGRGAAGLVDRLRGRPIASASARPSRTGPPPTCSASTPHCRPSRTKARAISTSAALAALSDDGVSTCWRRCNGRAPAPQPQPRFFAEGGFFAVDRKARFIAPAIPALRTDHPGLPACGSTPAACATSGTP